MTAANPKADRVYNRAPKGGVYCPVSNRFFKGGQFCPLCTLEQVRANSKPAPLQGSSRQVDWANGLRARRLAKIEAQLTDLIMGLDTIKPKYRPMYRPEIEGLAIERHRLMMTTSAVAIIDAR